MERRDSFPVALDLTQGREFHCSGQRFDSWKQRDSELRAEQGGWGNSTWGQDKGGTRAIDLFHLQAREKNIHNHGTRFPGLQDTLAEPNKSAHRKNEDRRCGESWGGDTAEPQLCLGCRQGTGATLQRSSAEGFHWRATSWLPVKPLLCGTSKLLKVSSRTGLRSMRTMAWRCIVRGDGECDPPEGVKGWTD